VDGAVREVHPGVVGEDPEGEVGQEEVVAASEGIVGVAAEVVASVAGEVHHEDGALRQEEGVTEVPSLSCVVSACNFVLSHHIYQRRLFPWIQNNQTAVLG